MDDVPPTVFEPSDAENGEFAITIDRGDAPVVRDVLRRAAEDRALKLRNATQRHARARNEREFKVLAKYAARFERVRLAEAERIGAKIRASQS